MIWFLFALAWVSLGSALLLQAQGLFAEPLTPYEEIRTFVLGLPAGIFLVLSHGLKWLLGLFISGLESVYWRLP